MTTWCRLLLSAPPGRPAKLEFPTCRQNDGCITVTLQAAPRAEAQGHNRAENWPGLLGATVCATGAADRGCSLDPRICLPGTSPSKDAWKGRSVGSPRAHSKGHQAKLWLRK